MLLGVSANGIIEGIPGGKNTEELLANIVRNNVIPAIDLSFSVVIIDGKLIGIVYIPKGKDKPYQTTDEQKEILLKNVDILAESGEVTLAGLLVFGINPSRHLFQNGISFAYFRGNTLDEELLDKQNIDGNLDVQVDTGTALLKNYLAVPSKIKGTKRENTRYVYPEKVFRELLTNAVVHRNYSITGSKIRVFLFKKRLEVISPGRLPNTVT